MNLSTSNAAAIDNTLRPPPRVALIVGPPRSGTTLLGSLLARQPGVLSLSEPLLAHAVLPAWRLKVFLRRICREAALSPTPTPTKPTERSYCDWLVERALHGGYKAVVIKETYRGAMPWSAWNNAGQIDRLVAGEIVERTTGEAPPPSVAIVRHPYAVAASTLKLCRLLMICGGWLGFLARLRWPVLPRIRSAEELVIAAAENWAAYARWQAGRKLPLLRYEDLVADSPRWIEWVCGRLEIPYDSNWQDDERIKRRAVGIGDFEVLRGRPRKVDQAAVSRGDQLTIAQRGMVRTICFEGAQSLGYTLDGAKEA